MVAPKFLIPLLDSLTPLRAPPSPTTTTPPHPSQILDLFTESTPTWSRFESYYGKPWVWNLLQVFGGRRATYGNLPSIAAGTVLNRTAPGSTMSGIGITPEATEITPVTFELLWEMAWRTEVPELETWLDAYVVRRYGVYPASPALLQAWGALLPGVYSSWYDYGITTSFCAMEAAPQLTPAAPSSAINPDAVVAALRLFLQAAGSDSRYDPVANPQFRCVPLHRRSYSALPRCGLAANLRRNPSHPLFLSPPPSHPRPNTTTLAPPSQV